MTKVFRILEAGADMIGNKRLIDIICDQELHEEEDKLQGGKMLFEYKCI